MSLFKKNILSQYNILGYKDNYLYLHCSRNEFVTAPFTGNLDAEGNLVVGNKTLSFKNIRLFNNSTIKIKAGEKIGIPNVSRYDGQVIANIGIMLMEDKDILDTFKYLRRRDIDEVKKTSKKNKKEKIIEETTSILEEYAISLDEAEVIINEVNSKEGDKND